MVRRRVSLSGAIATIPVVKPVDGTNLPLEDISSVVAADSIALAGAELTIAFVAVGVTAMVAIADHVSRPRYWTVVAWTVGGLIGGGLVGLVSLGLATERVSGGLVALALLAVGGAVGGAIAGVRIARAEAARETSERERGRWSSLFRNAPAAITDLTVEDGSLVIVAVNDAFRDWFRGDGDGDFRGQPFRAVVPIETDVEDLVSAVDDGRTVVTTFSLSAADGRRYYRLRLSPYSYENGEQRAHAILTDGTSLKEIEQELQRTVAELSNKNDRLERFASVVSHDLRNPLSVAAGNIELVEAPDDEDRLQRAAEALDRIDELVNDLLELAREGRTIDETTPLDLELVARSCWDTVETGRMELITDVDGTVHADEDRFRQLFENLFRNAREHAGEDVTVTVGTLDDASGFFVADDGPGVPEDEQEGVFEVGTSSTTGGTGLGLSIVSEIARAHGWTVELTESAEGGARFEFSGVETS